MAWGKLYIFAFSVNVVESLGGSSVIADTFIFPSAQVRELGPTLPLSIHIYFKNGHSDQ